MKKKEQINRREIITGAVRGACLVGLGGAAAALAAKGRKREAVWQIDPYKCISCGNCATKCVLKESAVKCVQKYEMCAYCDFCTGYIIQEPYELDTAAENQLCPTGAIERKFIEEPYYEYNIKEELCIGCAKCVKGCQVFGNGSLFLQVRHDRCLNCNSCAIAEQCPAQAFVRVPAERPYLFKGEEYNK